MSASTRNAESASLPRERMTGPLRILAALWLLMLFDVQWLLASLGMGPILRITTILMGLLGLVLVMGVQTTPAWSRRWTWFAPLLALALSGIPSYLVAVNTGFARDGVKVYLLWWLLCVATATMVGTTQRAEQIVKLYGLQFIWWVAWGGTAALVPWHHALNNNDAFGAFMVGGVSICFFLGMGAPKGTRFRQLMFVGAFLCMLGVVASYARGAFLAVVAVYGLMWLRSPRKLLTFGAGIGMVLVVVIAALTLFPPGFFYNEIMSAFAEGTSEGTGEDRAVLWGIAVRVWTEHPIIGVGIGNVGAYASGLYQPGDLAGMYGYNPGMLYGRSLHNIYFTILAEQGIVGSLIFLWILVDFWRRNAVLRSAAAQEVWRRLGGTLDIKQVGLGLELGMVAFLLTAFLYPMMEIHWFFTMLAVNLLLHRQVRPYLGQVRRGRVTRARGGPVQGAATGAGRSPVPGFATRV